METKTNKKTREVNADKKFNIKFCIKIFVRHAACILYVYTNLCKYAGKENKDEFAEVMQFSTQ